MPHDEEVREWLRLAKSDLQAARLLLGSDPPLLETGCFHCQQTVEKVLKGYLRWRGVDFPKVHALGLIFDLCEQEDASFAGIRDQGESLTRFAVQDRYPHGRPISAARASAALAAAETAYTFALARLPAEVHP
ncbi:MAG: HEPN domain-containing protein [Planctomycetota bacterium]